LSRCRPRDPQTQCPEPWQKGDSRSGFNDVPQSLGAGKSEFVANLCADTVELVTASLKRHEAAAKPLKLLTGATERPIHR